VSFVPTVVVLLQVGVSIGVGGRGGCGLSAIEVADYEIVGAVGVQAADRDWPRVDGEGLVDAQDSERIRAGKLAPFEMSNAAAS
jgi:hypothetical protein